MQDHTPVRQTTELATGHTSNEAGCMTYLIVISKLWKFPYLPNSAKHRISAVLCIIWKQFCRILRNPWHFHTMRKKYWNFRKFCVIFFHQILQILQLEPPNCIKLWFSCKILWQTIDSVAPKTKSYKFNFWSIPCKRVNSMNSSVLQITQEVPGSIYC